MSRKKYKILILGNVSYKEIGRLEKMFCYGKLRLENYEYDILEKEGYKKQMKIEEEEYLLELFDPCGTEKFSAMRDLFMKNAQGFVLLYSIISQSSFIALADIREQILRVKDTDRFPMILVGMNCELNDKRIISTEQGRQLAEKWNCPFIEASSEQNINLNNILIMLIKHIEEISPQNFELAPKPKKEGVFKRMFQTNRDTLMALPLSQEEMKKVDQPISSIDSQQEKKETKASSQCFSCKKEFTLFIDNALQCKHCNHKFCKVCFRKLDAEIEIQIPKNSMKCANCCRSEGLLALQRLDWKFVKKEEALGKGAYGNVWKCHYKKYVYAAKEISFMNHNAVEKIQKSTEKELSILSKLAHPNIVPLLGYIHLKDSTILFMPLYHSSLSRVLKDLSSEEKIKSIKQILHALDYLHNNKIAHQDLKGDNILIRKKENTMDSYITDFGVSRLFEDEETLLTSSIRGTPNYLSPELASAYVKGIKQRYDPFKADIWAFGLLIYEILHNFPPRIPLEQIINGAKPSFSKDREFPTLFKIFDICLTFQPEHRPTTSVLLKILEN